MRRKAARQRRSAIEVTDTVRKIEAELRTLHLAAYTLLTAAERKDQATRAKTSPGSMSKRLTLVTKKLMFAEWPWEQGFRVTPDLPYKRQGVCCVML